MAKPVPEDPEKRRAKAERRKRRRAAEAAGLQMLPRQKRPSAQMDHGCNPSGVRHAREGEVAMERERNRLMIKKNLGVSMRERLHAAVCDCGDDRGCIRGLHGLIEMITWLQSEEVEMVLVEHQRKDITGCICGWAELGQSHPKHVLGKLALQIGGGNSNGLDERA